MKKRISETNNGLLKVEIPVISLPAVGASFAEVLSRGEREFIELLTEGHSYEQIAKSMNVSINTVRDYVRSSYKKLKVNSRTQAVVKYLQAGPIRIYEFGNAG